MKPVILVIDMVKDLVRGELGDERFEEIIPNLERVIDAAKNNGVPIFYCNDAHSEDNPELEVWGEHAMKGTEGAQLIEELEERVEGEEEIVEKTCYGSFDGTELEEKLERSYDGEGADTVIITGIHTHLCDRHTAYGAFYRGYDVVFIRDATTAFTEEQHIKGLQYASENYNAEIMDAEKFIQEITS